MWALIRKKENKKRGEEKKTINSKAYKLSSFSIRFLAFLMRLLYYIRLQLQLLLNKLTPEQKQQKQQQQLEEINRIFLQQLQIISA